jgi:DNA modification methylase
MPMLIDLLQELDNGDFDMDMTGFEFGELERLMTSFADAGAELEEDEVPGLPEEPSTKRGDLWLLGDHRLVCGDATQLADVDRLMAGRTAKMMFTDPPWNVGIGQDSNPKHRQREGLKNDSLSPEKFQAFLDGFVTAVAPHLDGDVYCVLGASEWPRLDSTLRSHGFHWSATVIWVKDSFVLGRSKYHRRYEPIWYGWASGTKSSFCDRRDLDDVWEVPRPKKSEEHPTMKPVALVARAITASSKLSDVVIDPFLGSGTTLIAAEELGRACYGLELDPGYCDVIVARWEKLTGQKAVLDSSRRAGADG